MGNIMGAIIAITLISFLCLFLTFSYKKIKRIKKIHQIRLDMIDEFFASHREYIREYFSIPNPKLPFKMFEIDDYAYSFDELLKMDNIVRWKKNYQYDLLVYLEKCK